MTEGQIRLLRSAIEQPLIANQIEMSLLKMDWLDSVIHTNQPKGMKVSFPEGKWRGRKR
jgi:predicted oxidoreductase